MTKKPKTNNFFIKGLFYLSTGNFIVIFLELKRRYNLISIYCFIYCIYLKIQIRLLLNQKIVVVYDNQVSPPTYGDYLVVLMLVRFLNFFSKKVIFILVQDKFRSDWDSLSKQEISNFMDQQVVLGNFVLKDFDLQNFQVLTSTQLHKYLRNKKNLIISPSFNYQHASGLIQLLVSFKLRMNNFPENFLFSDKDFNLVIPYKFVSWHVRLGTWGLERNPSESSILNDFISLRNLFPEYKIMLFSTNAGLKHTLSVLKNNLPQGLLGDIENSLVEQPVADFTSCIPYLHKSEFYFQRIGGGLGEIVNYSRVPFIIVENKGYYYFSSRFQLLPWHRKDQIRTGLTTNYVSMPLESLLELM